MFPLFFFGSRPFFLFPDATSTALRFSNGSDHPGRKSMARRKDLEAWRLWNGVKSPKFTYGNPRALTKELLIQVSREKLNQIDHVG